MHGKFSDPLFIVYTMNPQKVEKLTPASTPKMAKKLAFQETSWGPTKNQKWSLFWERMGGPLPTQSFWGDRAFGSTCYVGRVTIIEGRASHIWCDRVLFRSRSDSSYGKSSRLHCCSCWYWYWERYRCQTANQTSHGYQQQCRASVPRHM